MTMKFRPGFNDPKGILAQNLRTNGIVASGSTVPTTGTAGFEAGCLFFVYAGALNTQLYMNRGSSTSCNFQPLLDDSFGGGGAAILPSGNIYRTALTVANGISPSATGADKIVDCYTLPAASFASGGQMIQFTLWGTFANNAHAKEVKVQINATNTGLPTNSATGNAGQSGTTDGTVTATGGSLSAIIDSTSITTSGGGGWLVTGQLIKTTPTASNKQESMTTSIIFGATHSGIGTWTDQTITESSAILFIVTCSAATTATDIVYQGMEITASN